MRLNEKEIRNLLKPERGNRVYRDEEVPGFGIRVTAAGARAFVLNYTAEGRERRLTIGAWPAWTATAARERAKELRRRIDQGQDPLAEKEARREAPTFRDVGVAYLERHAGGEEIRVSGQRVPGARRIPGVGLPESRGHQAARRDSAD